MDGPGLYIHIPFCRTKCGYCAFDSQPWPGEGPEDYLQALLQELKQAAAGWGQGRRFASLFVGGGTPTIYRGPALAELLVNCRERFAWVENPEITLECNPNTVTADDLSRCRAAGANRLSLGVQSFSDRLLKRLGRSHTATQARQAVIKARQAGFANLNLDLIYGLPGQTSTDWRQSLQAALALEPEHLALYELSVEPGTPFHAQRTAGKLVLPEDDRVAEMAELANELLFAHGYRRYEISNYARPGFACRHNLNYWENGPYLGLGAGAVSSFDGLRLKNLPPPDQYQARITAGLPAFLEGEALSLEASFRETVILGLRMLAGVNLVALHERYGLDPLAYYGPALPRLKAQGLVDYDQLRLWLTARALPVANQVLSLLV